MNIPTVARSAIRANYRIGSGEKITQVIQLQGRIRFAGAERVIREIVDTHYTGTRIALDISRVYSVDEVAQHMLLEIMRRMRHEGYTVYLIDQDDTITNLEALKAMDVAVLGSIDELEHY